MAFVKEHTWRQSSSVVSSPLENQLALLDTRSNVYYSLDGIGPVLWDALAQGACLTQLCAIARERYDVSARVAEADIAHWIAEMSAAGLIVARE